MSNSPAEIKTVRDRLGAVLEKYSFKSLLDTYSDQTIQDLLKAFVLPLNIQTLEAAKAEIFRQTGCLPDILISSVADQETIWNCFQEFMKTVQK